MLQAREKFIEAIEFSEKDGWELIKGTLLYIEILIPNFIIQSPMV